MQGISIALDTYLALNNSNIIIECKFPFELANVHAGFRKGRGTRDQIANIHWIMERAREVQKNIYFCFTD